jgi:hypothetical protein
MEQRAVIHFFTFKGLKARAIHTELESVSGPEAFALLTVKKWRRAFHQGRTDLFDDLRWERPLANGLAGQLALCLKKGCSVRARCFVATSGLERRSGYRSFMTSLARKVPPSLGVACSIDQPEEQKIVILSSSPSDGIIGTDGERFSRDYHGRLVVVRLLLRL